jgi:hypothetical protein
MACRVRCDLGAAAAGKSHRAVLRQPPNPPLCPLREAGRQSGETGLPTDEPVGGSEVDFLSGPASVPGAGGGIGRQDGTDSLHHKCVG